MTCVVETVLWLLCGVALLVSMGSLGAEVDEGRCVVFVRVLRVG